MKRNEIAFPQFTVLTPLPGTVPTRRLSDAGQLDRSRYDFRLLDFLHASTPTRLPLRSFYEQLAGLYARTSMNANLHVYRRALRNGVISREGCAATRAGGSVASSANCPTWKPTSRPTASSNRAKGNRTCAQGSRRLASVSSPVPKRSVLR